MISRFEVGTDPLSQHAEASNARAKFTSNSDSCGSLDARSARQGRSVQVFADRSAQWGRTARQKSGTLFSVFRTGIPVEATRRGLAIEMGIISTLIGPKSVIVPRPAYMSVSKSRLCSRAFAFEGVQSQLEILGSACSAKAIDNLHFSGVRNGNGAETASGKRHAVVVAICRLAPEETPQRHMHLSPSAPSSCQAVESLCVLTILPTCISNRRQDGEGVVLDDSTGRSSFVAVSHRRGFGCLWECSIEMRPTLTCHDRRLGRR